MAGLSEGIFSPTPGIKLMLIVVIGVAIIQQVTGIEAIMYYSNQIIKVRTHSRPTHTTACAVSF